MIIILLAVLLLDVLMFAYIYRMRSWNRSQAMAISGLAMALIMMEKEIGALKKQFAK